ncbi:MAG: SDR family oxidoreductase [Magnetococcales bacterium]|nr:SDR family oxidoreductase [Magnetococcales bacterium]
MDDVQGKRVLVTGASSGIGAAVAQLFARKGACVGVHYAHNRSGAEEVLAAIRAQQGEAVLLQCDLLQVEERSRLVEQFVARYGGVDVLVNNAGAAISFQDFRQITQEEWWQAMALNAEAPLWLSRLVWSYMAQNHWGRIINISTAAVKFGGSPNGVHYVAAKAALEGITMALAKAGAASNILVNAIRCGIIDTGIYKKLPGYTQEQFIQRGKKAFLGRAGTTDEVAGWVLFLASSAAGYTTGELISVAGGD